jgi:phage-related protein
MAGSRTLKLSILGDVDNLNKSLKTATQDVETFGDKMGKVGKVVGAAFAAAAAAAGAYAIKIGIEGVKAAIEDEKAQTQLALALENATGATKAQIAATEDSILQMSLATGVADDQLRPALGRLVRSTGDTEKAQQLLAQALDISAATGKPLETVAAALSKGFDGNTAALGKLGVGLSAAELKTMSFTEVQDKLTELFGGAAAKNAETYSGRIARLQVAFDEAKETIGFALLPILEKLIGFINDNALPIINAFSGAFSLNGNGLGGVITSLGNVIVNTFTPIINGLLKAFGYVKDAIGDNADTFREFGVLIATYVAPVIGTVLGGALQVAGKIAGGVIDVIAGVVKILNGLISGAVAGINALISAYNSIPFLPNVGKITTPTVSVPTIATPSVSTSVPSIPSITVPSGNGTTTSSGSGVSTAAKVAATAAAATNVVAGSFNPGSFRMAEARDSGTTINLNVSGAFDKEGTARTIVETLNSSFYRGTGGAGQLQAI